MSNGLPHRVRKPSCTSVPALSTACNPPRYRSFDRRRSPTLQLADVDLMEAELAAGSGRPSGRRRPVVTSTSIELRTALVAGGSARSAPAALWMRSARAWWNRRVTCGWRCAGARRRPSAGPDPRAPRARPVLGFPAAAPAVPLVTVRQFHTVPGGGSGTGRGSVPPPWAPVPVPGSDTINDRPAVLARPRSVRCAGSSAARQRPTRRPELSQTICGGSTTHARATAASPHPGRGHHVRQERRQTPGRARRTPGVAAEHPTPPPAPTLGRRGGTHGRSRRPP
jgi:hypothetical protein